MSLKFDLRLLESNTEINKKILEALLKDVDNYLSKIYNAMRSKIPPIIIESIKNQPEYNSLISGSLKGEFGISDPENRLSQILSVIQSGSIVTKNPTKISTRGISGGIQLQMVKADFSDLLTLGSASFVTEKGTQLNWLQWLLIEGDSIIIDEYAYNPGSNPRSRTGMGVMRKANGAFWRVPPEFAGNIKNNWITRAIDSASSLINQELNKLTRV